MYLDYIKERYQPEDFFMMTPERIAETFENALTSSSLHLIKKPYGFITYALQGDAVIIYDMYVKPSHRGHTYAWELHDQVMEHARDLGKRVAITMTEVAGKNHRRGIGAMKVSGFVPYQRLNDSFMFIKGI